ncbi:hypothetical protein F2Q70_00004948 [Brassica cretica]|uniref:Uncharacterized protein n=1 Tax=Brassica cretica TaxID=69181 RepID=A0A8S9IW60_BRACR|nr:hypothetical protein F2Q70_00004948 [Brassica cretica]
MGWFRFLSCLDKKKPTMRLSNMSHDVLTGDGLTYQEIVNIFLGDGSMRRGQVVGVDGEKSAVQTCPRIGKSAPVYITIGDGEKLKHQHHCKGSRGIKSRSKSSSSLRWRSFNDTERTKHLQNGLLMRLMNLFLYSAFNRLEVLRTQKIVSSSVFTDIVGKTYTFQLSVIIFNYTAKHQTFTVSRIFDERQRLRVPDMEATMAWEMI